MHSLELFNYRSEIHALRQLRAGSYRLAMGRMTILSNLTHSNSTYCFAVLYLGQQTMIGSIRNDMSVADFDTITPNLEELFKGGNISEVIGLINNNFGSETFSLWHLFRDEKRRILMFMTDRTLEIAAKNFSDVYYDNYQLMSTMRANDLPLPDAYRAAVRFTLHRRLQDVLTDEVTPDTPFDHARLERVVTEDIHWNLPWSDRPDLNKAAATKLHWLVSAAFTTPDYWNDALYLLEAIPKLNLDPNFYRAQNAFLEGWTNKYLKHLDSETIKVGLMVAQELNLELGFSENE